MKINSMIFRIILVIVGVIMVLIGVNVGFGGILTLGMQGQTRFFEVTNEPAFLVRDSHIRFFGGVYLALGLFVVYAVKNLHKYEIALKLIFAAIFVGGLARFSARRPDVVFGNEIVGSLIAELVLMPILFIWLTKIVSNDREIK